MKIAEGGDADIRHWVLAETPIGTSRTQVLAVVSQHGWEDVRYAMMPVSFNRKFGHYVFVPIFLSSPDFGL